MALGLCLLGLCLLGLCRRDILGASRGGLVRAMQARHTRGAFRLTMLCPLHHGD